MLKALCNTRRFLYLNQQPLPKNRLNLRVQPIFYPSRSFLITTPKGVYIIKVGKADLVSHHAERRV